MKTYTILQISAWLKQYGAPEWLQNHLTEKKIDDAPKNTKSSLLEQKQDEPSVYKGGSNHLPGPMYGYSEHHPVHNH